jgi:aminoglycoside phosphotransferase (APT) family kinase protein
VTQRKMHADELETSAGLVRRLLAEQFPHWADLPVEQVDSSGTVNALYRLGDDMLVRLPRTEWAKDAVERELRFLPKLAPHLPVEVPVPLAQGVPAEGYPREWGVYPWLEGEHPTAGATADAEALATDLALLVHTLQRLDVDGGHPAARGSSLARFDAATRSALAELEGVIDTKTTTTAWEQALEALEWGGAPVWMHGDLMPANLLVRDGRLAAVIDWEGFGVGDPAVDLMVAWNLLTAETRSSFRATIDVDDATWIRGRGWALWTGLVALPYYCETNPVLADNARYRIEEVLTDFRASSG